MRLDTLKPLALGIDLALVHGDPFLVDALPVHESVGRDRGLGSVVHRLLDRVVGIEDIHRPGDRDHADQPIHEHLLALLRLIVFRDRAAFVELIVLVLFRSVEILGFALQEIHLSYLPVGTTT